MELEQKLGLMFCSISLKNGFGGDGDLSIDGDLNFFTQGLISDGKMGMGRDSHYRMTIRNLGYQSISVKISLIRKSGIYMAQP